MKKIFSVVMVLLLAFMPIGVFADNDTETNNTINQTDIVLVDVQEDIVDTENSVVVSDDELLADKSGVEIRLLQLTKHLEARIEQANEIISDVEEKGVEVPEGMFEIIVGFEDALNKIEELDMSQDSDVLAQKYVSIKKEIIDLSKDFKELAKDIFTEDEKAELRAENKEKVKAKISENKEKIEELKNKFSKSQINKKYNALGFDDEELMSKIQSGELSNDEIKDLIKEKISTLTDEEKVELKLKSLENKKKEKIENKNIHEQREKVAKEEVEKVKNNLKEKFENLSEEEKETLKDRFKSENKEFQEKFNEQREELRKEFDERKEEFQNMSEEERKELMFEMKDSIKEFNEDRKEFKKESHKMQNNSEDQEELEESEEESNE